MKGEKTENLVIEKCGEAGIKIDKADLVNTHRLGAARSVGDKPRPIIARFSDYSMARTVISTVKDAGKQARARNVKSSFWAREHLSELRAKILQKCLALKRNKAIAACWVYNYSVYYKKTTTDEKGIKVSCLDEVGKIAG